MPRCIDCDKSGLFLNINKFGLCKSCYEIIETKISRAIKIIQSAIKVVENSTDDEERIKNCDIIIENAKIIIEYEKSGIITTEPLPSELIKVYSVARDRLIAKTLNQNLNKILINFENEIAQYANIAIFKDILANIQLAKDLLSEEGVPRVIAISNHKGGVGKTTSTINIGGGLAQFNKKVLLIDFDPQSNLTDGLGKELKDDDFCVYHMLKGDVSYEELVINISENLSLIPSNLILAKVEREFAGTNLNVFMLKNCLSKIKNFDFILIDCPPSLSVLTMNALAAAQEVIIPLQPEYYSLKGIHKLLDAIEFVKKKINKSLVVLGIIGTRFNIRSSLHKEVLDKIHESLGDKIFNSIIRENISLAEASSYGKTIFDYKPNSHGAEDYKNLCIEILSRKV